MMHALLLSLVGASLTTTLDLKERPVSKVIRLLGEMQAELQKEGEQDQELYDKLNCWCEVNGKEKTAAIVEANRRIESLTADIERLTANGASLQSSIADLTSQVAAAEQALAKASSIRAEELAEYNAEDKDLISSIRALDGALTTLGKHQSFLQGGSAMLSNVAVLRHALVKAQLSDKSRKAMESFLQQPAGYQSYASNSGPIYGILSQMKETFESNMGQADQDEATAVKTFNGLKAAKTEEIRAGTAMLESQNAELAQTDEDNAAAKSNLHDTREALGADTVFLADLKKRCGAADAEFEERSKTRAEELEAVSETIGILNNDESHDLMGSVLGFVQVDTRRSKAMLVLRKAGMGKLAGMVQLDAFTQVNAAIDEMVTALNKEMSDEVKHRDFCIKDFAENDQQQAVAQDELSDLQSEIATLESTIDTLARELAGHHNEVSESKTQMQRASEDREAENSDFQTTVADQRQVQAILTKALARLQEFYGKSFVQSKVAHKAEPGAAAPPPPASFDKYEKNKKSGGALGLIKSIIAEAKRMETDAVRAEADSQSAYEEFIKDSNKSIAALQKAIADKTGRKADSQARLVAAKGDLAKTLDDSENLNNYKGTLHKTCDYVMNNFDARQEARGAEIQALGEAKAILAGAQ